jgi:hypothetical protein
MPAPDLLDRTRADQSDADNYVEGARAVDCIKAVGG